MEILERIWEIVTGVFGAAASLLERGLTSLFGSSNARFLKALQPKVEAINALEPKYQVMSDAELRQQTDVFRDRLAKGETLDDLLVEAFAVCREGGRRFIGLRHYDVQLLGGMVLHNGAIAEMMTGEGKTLVATMPAYLNALAGRGVHVVTVNSYLARRDMEWMGPLYMGLGLTVGAIYNEMKAEDRQRAYDCDITYGTNNEFGFDYLRDNMRPAAKDDDRFPKSQQQCQRELNYAIIDEVDNILIDEARTPLIISGPAHDDVTRYAKADRVARQLKRDVHFEVKEKEHSAHLTDDGVREAERLAGVESFYTAGNMEWPHLIDNSLKAHFLYKRDVNYVVADGEVVIVDEFTGRLMPGRHWSDGLHQAVEAKEGVKVKEESQTYATVTLQNFFKLYRKISGMTGTAMTEAAEFWKIYKLDVIAMPTNRDLRRVNHADVIYRTEREKYLAIVEEVERLNKFDSLTLANGEVLLGSIERERDRELDFQVHEERTRRTIPRTEIKSVSRRGRPILVGTVSIEKSERLSAMLGRRGVKHEVLNAKHHQREAEIIAQAGRKNAVTIATNMAGRGTDIILGGNPETMAWARLQSKYASRLDVPQAEWIALVAEIEAKEQMKKEGEEVKSVGGLHIIGSERHEARRIDLQLRGRCGRQGDPGSSRFFLSLEDDLMRIFAGEWVKNILTKLGMQEGEAIESGMVSRRIEGAQRKVEERNFESRKSLLDYDEVMDEQRKRVYGFRQEILDGVNCKSRILEMLGAQIERRLDEFLDRDYGTTTFAAWAGGELGCEFDARDYRGLEFEAAIEKARDEAVRAADSQIYESIEENLPSDEVESEWNWEALAKWANSRWRLNFNDRQLKKIGRDLLQESIGAEARKAVENADLERGRAFLAPDFGVLSACGWVAHKFGIELDPDDVRELETPAFKRLVQERALAAYEEKEIEYPVMAGIYHFASHDSAGQKRLDRDGLIAWAQRRFGAQVSESDLRSKQRDEIAPLLIEFSRQQYKLANQAIARLQHEVATLFAGDSTAARVAGDLPALDGQLTSLADRLHAELNCPLTDRDLAQLSREELESELLNAVEDRYRPEIRRMERLVVLEILDTAWKEHLLAMDHLRNSVGLVGYAQVDPKVEYKREGMKIYERMWESVAERSTDAVFRIEQLDEGFVSSTWVAGHAEHRAAPAVSQAQQNQEAAINSSDSAHKPEPIRLRGEQVGRNDPCPCGSGKKYKQCCLRTGGGVRA